MALVHSTGRTGTTTAAGGELETKRRPEGRRGTAASAVLDGLPDPDVRLRQHVAAELVRVRMLHYELAHGYAGTSAEVYGQPVLDDPARGFELLVNLLSRPFFRTNQRDPSAVMGVIAAKGRCVKGSEEGPRGSGAGAARGASVHGPAASLTSLLPGLDS